MEVYHVTEVSAVPLIETNGLRTCYSKTRDGRQAVWVCEEPQLAWAINRVRRRKGVYEEDVVIVPADIPADWLVNVQPFLEVEGIWACLRDIPPSMLGKTFSVWPLEVWSIKWGGVSY